MKGLNFVKMLDQQVGYLALLECLPHLEQHQVAAYLVHLVCLWEASDALPSMVRADLAIEPDGHLYPDTRRASSAPLADHH